MGANELFMLYYLTFAGCVGFYFWFSRRLRHQLASASNFAFVYAFVMIGLPGYYVADGTISNLINSKFNTGLDMQLYWLYLLFMPLVSLALPLGQVAGQRIFVKTVPRKHIEGTIRIFLVVFAVYCLAYLVWLPYIPLNTFLRTSSLNLSDIYLQRIAITHGLGYITDLPFAFRYWRNIAQYLIPIFCYYHLVTRKIKNRSGIFTFFLVLYSAYLQIFTLEKEPFFVFSLGMLFLYYLRRQAVSPIRAFSIKNFKYVVGLAIVFVVFVSVFKSFMNVQNNLWASIISRFSNQSASDYIQIEYVRQTGFLGFTGIKMPFLTSLLKLEFIDPSKYAIYVMAPSYVVGDIMGAAGGMSLTNLYYIAGWFAIPIFFVFVYIFGCMDQVIRNTIYNSNNRGVFFLNICFYTVFAMHFAIAVGSSVWILCAIPTVLSPPLIIISAVYLTLIRMPRHMYVR